MLATNATFGFIGPDGSIDWMCLPRFDSAACFAASLGSADNGRWLMAPAAGSPRVNSAYVDQTLIHDTIFDADTGVVCVSDWTLRRGGIAELARVGRRPRGRALMRTGIKIRFDFGAEALPMSGTL